LESKVTRQETLIALLPNTSNAVEAQSLKDESGRKQHCRFASLLQHTLLIMTAMSYCTSP